MKNETIQYKFYKFSLLTLLMFISSLNYNLLINPSKIVSGGTSGISIIIEHIFKISPSITILFIDAVLLIIALVLSEYKLVTSALYASIIYPFFVELTGNIRLVLEVSNSDYIAISIFAGLVSGVISGFVCKLNMSQGGTTMIAQLINKKFKVSISDINTFMNCIVVILGAFIFGINNIFYAFVFIISNRFMLDKVMLGTSQKKFFQIITYDEKEVKRYISEILHAGHTTISARGGYNNSKQTIIMTSIRSMDYFKLKEGIRQIDPKAFIVITDSYQVKGGK